MKDVNPRARQRRSIGSTMQNTNIVKVRTKVRVKLHTDGEKFNILTSKAEEGSETARNVNEELRRQVEARRQDMLATRPRWPRDEEHDDKFEAQNIMVKKLKELTWWRSVSWRMISITTTWRTWNCHCCWMQVWNRRESLWRNWLQKSRIFYVTLSSNLKDVLERISDRNKYSDVQVWQLRVSHAHFALCSYGKEWVTTCVWQTAIDFEEDVLICTSDESEVVF